MFTNGWAETYLIPENYKFTPLNTAGRIEHKVARQGPTGLGNHHSLTTSLRGWSQGIT